MTETSELSSDQAASRVYIGRQLIIDREQKIIGYELLYRHAAYSTQADFEDEMEASAAVFSNLLTHMGMEWLLGDNLAFINVSPAVLESDLVNLLPPGRIAFEVVGATPTPALLERCRELRSRGYAIVFDGVLPNSTQGQLLKVADYVKLDVQAIGLKGLTQAMAAFKGQAVKLIAAKVETPAEFRACKELGFVGFQGYHFARPEILSTRAINPVHTRVIQLLNMIRGNAEFNEIETALKCDVALSVRLLRYINSVGMGRAQQVRSINHALVLLGYRQLYRWLSLLILAPEGIKTPPALAKTALVRGRLTELLGQSRLEGQERDNLFIVGVFSLVDAILGVPMDKLLESLSLPDNIGDALLNRSGIYAIYLELAEACENADWLRLDELARQSGLSAEQINHAHLHALAWAEDIPL
jgi:EAL and modified HD-GYP domain-containing signal transduction protein